MILAEMKTGPGDQSPSRLPAEQRAGYPESRGTGLPRHAETLFRASHDPCFPEETRTTLMMRAWLRVVPSIAKVAHLLI